MGEIIAIVILLLISIGSFFIHIKKKGRYELPSRNKYKFRNSKKKS